MDGPYVALLYIPNLTLNLTTLDKTVELDVVIAQLEREWRGSGWLYTGVLSFIVVVFFSFLLRLLFLIKVSLCT